MNFPLLGFGCSPFLADGTRADLEPAVREAVDRGYRLFDGAELYGNERAVGRALRHASPPPLLVGKVWRTNYRPEALVLACRRSLERLGAEAFDAYLLHAPGPMRHIGPLDDVEEIGVAELERRAAPRTEDGSLALDDVPLNETWAAMQELVRAGLVRAAGVSNFDSTEMESLVPLPSVSQIATVPFAASRDHVAFCARRQIVTMGYSPFSPPGLVDDPVVRGVAAELQRTPWQIVLRWIIQRGMIPLPSSRQPQHIAENIEVLEFEIPPRAMESLSMLEHRPAGS